MGRAVTVSFDDTDIKVVYAVSKGSKTLIKDTLTLKDDQFDDFLIKEKTKEFTVVNSFKDFFQETILIPPVKKRFIKNLVESEIKKKAPFEDLSFIFIELGEKLVENKRMKEVFVFAVKNKEINGIVDRFINKGKVVRAIYPDIFSIASLVDSKDIPVLCVSETRYSKNMFLSKDGKVQFIRTAQSLEHGVSDLDIQNINMTVNYCRQTLRINPSLVMLTGSLSSYYSPTTATSIPIACLARQSDIYLDFITPISAFSVSRKADLLTKEYRDFFKARLVLRYSAIVFLALSIIGIGYSVYAIKNIIELKSRLGSIRGSLPDVGSMLSAYDSKRSELARGYMPFVTSLNNAASVPDAQRLLSLLSELTADNIRIDSISITAGDKTFRVGFKGIVRAARFAEMQTSYQRFIDTISLKGLAIKNHRLELKDKSFQIDIEYR